MKVPDLGRGYAPLQVKEHHIQIQGYRPPLDIYVVEGTFRQRITVRPQDDYFEFIDSEVELGGKTYGFSASLTPLSVIEDAVCTQPASSVRSESIWEMDADIMFYVNAETGLPAILSFRLTRDGKPIWPDLEYENVVPVQAYDYAVGPDERV